MPPSHIRIPQCPTPTPGTRRRQGILRFKKTSRSSAGFTLIETIASLSILSIGVLGVAAGLLSAMTVSTQSRAKTEAIFIAQQQLEIFRIMTIAELKALDTGGAVVIDNGSGVNGSQVEFDSRFTQSWIVELDTPATDVISLTVIVSWTDDDGTVRSTQLRTYRAGS